jgi:two-component sensor histidine kinase/chemotaxis signal transduction protein
VPNKNNHLSIPINVDDTSDENLVNISKKIISLEQERLDKELTPSEEFHHGVEAIIDHIRMGEIGSPSLVLSLKKYADLLSHDDLDLDHIQMTKKELSSCIDHRWENKNYSINSNDLSLKFRYNQDDYRSFILFIKDTIKNIKAFSKIANITESELKNTIVQDNFWKFYYNLKNISNFFGLYHVSKKSGCIERVIRYLKKDISIPPDKLLVLIKEYNLWTIDELNCILILSENKNLPFELKYTFKVSTSIDELCVVLLDSTRIKMPVNEISNSTCSTTELSNIELDYFLNDIGGLINLSHVFKHAIAIVEKSNIDRVEIQKFKDNYLALDDLSEKLQRRMIELRKVEIGHIFPDISKLVHQFSRDFNKKSVVEFHGEHVNIDGTILSYLNKSIYEIITNCFEHGIESPIKRLEQNKEPIAKITIQAEERDNEVIVTIKDDGKGLPIELFSKKALEQNLISEDNLSKSSNEDLFNLFFSLEIHLDEQHEKKLDSGISLVKEMMAEVGGTIKFYSSENLGTSISLSIPKSDNLGTRSILRAMVGQQYFGIPMENIEYLSVIDTKKRLPVVESGVEVFPYREKLLPIIVLSELFDIDFSMQYDLNSDERSFVILRIGESKYALEVTKLDEFGVQVSQNLLHGHFDEGPFEGASVMGNGCLCLMISLDKIMCSFAHGKQQLDSHTLVTIDDSQSSYKNIKNTLIFRPSQSKIMLSIDMISVSRIDNFVKESLSIVKKQRVYNSKLGYMQYFEFSDFGIADALDSCKDPKSILVMNIYNRPIAFGVYDIVDMYSGELLYLGPLNVSGINESWTYKDHLVGVVDLDHISSFFRNISSQQKKT